VSRAGLADSPRRLAEHHRRTLAGIEAHDANLVGGDIAAGVTDLRQFFTRPTWRT
jgi:hypothetical protein